MKIEKTEIHFRCDKIFTTIDAPAIRGFFGREYIHLPEFHGHIGNRFTYKHPLIQYKIINGKAIIIGLKEGA